MDTGTTNACTHTLSESTPNDNSGLADQIQTGMLQEDEFYDSDPKLDDLLGVDEEHNNDSEREKGDPNLILDEMASEEFNEDEGDSIVAVDVDNSKIEIGALFPDVKTFRIALRHFAIKNDFEFQTVKSDKKRFIGKCKNSDCQWRIRASVLQDNKTFQVKVLPHAHTCPSTSMVDGSMASKAWVSEKISGWLKKNPATGAKALKDRLEEKFHVKVSYAKAWKGKQHALQLTQGGWEDNFQLLYNFKADLETTCPGSIVEVDCIPVDGNMLFNRVFVALRPCIDGFLQGCRPYLAVDSTHLTGKYKRQLASAIGVYGHSCLYPVAYGVFDLETTDNWEWFLTQLRRAIGTPPGLAISSDACKGLGSAVAKVFAESEHRECMGHLMQNFKKRFHGDVFSDNMWPSSLTYIKEKSKYHLDQVRLAAPAAIEYLDKNHKLLWRRSEFSELTKCDYDHNLWFNTCTIKSAGTKNNN